MTRHALGAAFILLILGVVAHILLTVYIPGSGASARWKLRGGSASRVSDPWVLARQLAAQGRYTEAAHALYLALLARVAARVPLRLHDSKTAGDYARELRHTAPNLFGPFREFARSYEIVIYALGECDRSRFDSLIALAGRIDPELTQLAGVGHG
ncbi:MAG TPA: DUF4129 domain-containing protein [Gemmatimonadaceae bacterium]|nr:DUF4129 domain-containing protein [Gemmatimonadaceae bacterium]